MAGGADAVQLREKEETPAGRYAWGRRLQALCRRLGVPLIVNDDLEVAVALGAEGLHLGQEDLHPADARLLLGQERWIGWSTHDLEQAEEAAETGADYAGFGPVFATGTKAGAGRPRGPQALLAARAVARVPLLAIGGIRPGNAGLVPRGVGLAVSSALCAAEDPEAVARALCASREPPSPHADPRGAGR